MTDTVCADLQQVFSERTAEALVAHVVSRSRRDAFKIVPLCPFFKSQLDRHPEWQDVIST